MSLTDHLPHRKPRKPGRHEHVATMALPAPLPAPVAAGTTLQLDVPEAQRRAERESGPQRMLTGPQQALPQRRRVSAPQTAAVQRPDTGPQPTFTPAPYRAPAPELPEGWLQRALAPAAPPWEQPGWEQTQAIPVAQGRHPYGPPQAPQERYSGPQRIPTEGWRPEFAEASELARPYAPENDPLLGQVPDPDDDLPAAVAYYELKGEWPPLPGESDALKLQRQQVMSLPYPKAGSSFRAYAALMRALDRITGTRGTGWWPLTAVGETGSSPDDPAAWPPYDGPAVPVVVRRAIRAGVAA